MSRLTSILVANMRPSLRTCHALYKYIFGSILIIVQQFRSKYFISLCTSSVPRRICLRHDGAVRFRIFNFSHSFIEVVQH